MIYVISLDDSQIVKIGHGKDPRKRVEQLQIGSPKPLILQWVHEGDDKLENHLHAVFKEYRIRGEWFDLTPLGDAVTAVREAVESVAGEQLQKPDRFRGPSVVHPVDTARTDQPAPVSAPSDEQEWARRFPPLRSEWLRTWHERFPPVPSATASDREPRPGCIRSWKGECLKPAGMTCNC